MKTSPSNIPASATGTSPTAMNNGESGSEAPPAACHSSSNDSANPLPNSNLSKLSARERFVELINSHFNLLREQVGLDRAGGISNLDVDKVLTVVDRIIPKASAATLPASTLPSLSEIAVLVAEAAFQADDFPGHFCDRMVTGLRKNWVDAQRPIQEIGLLKLVQKYGAHFVYFSSRLSNGISGVIDPATSKPASVESIFRAVNVGHWERRKRLGPSEAQSVDRQWKTVMDQLPGNLLAVLGSAVNKVTIDDLTSVMKTTFDHCLQKSQESGLPVTTHIHVVGSLLRSVKESIGQATVSVPVLTRIIRATESKKVVGSEFAKICLSAFGVASGISPAVIFCEELRSLSGPDELLVTQKRERLPKEINLLTLEASHKERERSGIKLIGGSLVPPLQIQHVGGYSVVFREAFIEECPTLLIECIEAKSKNPLGDTAWVRRVHQALESAQKRLPNLNVVLSMSA